VIFCKIDGHDSDYIIDLRTDKLIVLKRSEVKEELKYDCTIRIKRYDIEELIVGELNPQIAMLSHKIQITGSMNMAMYFFNLFD
jgi:putative sterol carrier protein